MNLVLSDIHMPGLSGLEFLESLMFDAKKRQIPVLIMTNLPTIEKEKKALNLGAADFVDKTLFTSKKEELLNRVRMKLVTNVPVPEGNEDLISRKTKLVSKVMAEAIRNDFDATSETFCRELKDRFNADYIAFWNMYGDAPELVCVSGTVIPENYSAEDLTNEACYRSLRLGREPYLTNHMFNGEYGIMLDFSEKHNLPAEIGVPIFSVDERKLLMNNMEVPSDAPLFGYFFIKRNKLYSSKEYEMLSRLLVQSGSILWRLYSK